MTNPSSYWQGIADAYSEATDSPVAAVERYLQDHGALPGPNSARNAIFLTRRKGYLQPTRRGVATAGAPVSPYEALAEALRVSTDDLRMAADMVGVRVLRRPPTRSLTK